MDEAVQSPPAGQCVHDVRRRPEETVLYPLVPAQAETFFAQVEAETGMGLPDFVKDTFDAFLKGGTLANGFLRRRCEDCFPEKLVAFSGKRRGFCPGYGVWRRRPPTGSITSSPASPCAHGGYRRCRLLA
jgi:hypothetical protein